MSVPHYPLFIDGEWVDSPERYEIRSPATGELVATVAKGGTEHIDQAIAAAKAAHASAHILTWAIGLLLLDNCDFSALRRAHGPGTKVAGALVVALLAVEGANGVNLNPIVLS